MDTHRKTVQQVRRTVHPDRPKMFGENQCAWSGDCEYQVVSKTTYMKLLTVAFALSMMEDNVDRVRGDSCDIRKRLQYSQGHKVRFAGNVVEMKQYWKE